MRFGTDKRKFFATGLLIVIGIINACSQSQESKMKESQKHADKALNLRQQGDVKGAIQEQLKAVEVNPDDSDLLVNLIGFYADDKDFKKAKETAEKALKLIPNNGWVNYLYGEILEREDNYDEALKYRSRAVEIEPQNPLFLSNLGSVQESVGDKKAAKESFTKTLQIDGNFIFALLRLGQLEEEEGNTKRAAELYQKIINIPSENYQPADKVFVDEAKEKLSKLKDKKPI